MCIHYDTVCILVTRMITVYVYGDSQFCEVHELKICSNRLENEESFVSREFLA
jgi:hypothetical protein